MTNLKCPKGHDDVFKVEKYYYQKLYPWIVIICNSCRRPYFEMDCLKECQFDYNCFGTCNYCKVDDSKDNDPVNTPSAGEPITESPITSDKDGCLDFEKHKPEIGQKIFARLKKYSDPDFKAEGTYLGPVNNTDSLGFFKSTLSSKQYMFDEWKSAVDIEIIAQGDDTPFDINKKVEYCQCDKPLGKALRCSVHHDQTCGHNEDNSCKMERYCAYCENVIDPDKFTIIDTKVDKEPEISCQSECEHDEILHPVYSTITQQYFTQCLKCESWILHQTPRCSCGRLLNLELLDNKGRITKWKCFHCTNQPKQEDDCTNCTDEASLKIKLISSEIENKIMADILKYKCTCIDKTELINSSVQATLSLIIEALQEVMLTDNCGLKQIGKPIHEIMDIWHLLFNFKDALKELKDK